MVSRPKNKNKKTKTKTNKQTKPKTLQTYRYSEANLR